MSYLIAVDSGHGMETAGKRTPQLLEDLVISGKVVRKKGEQIHEKEWNQAVADAAMSALLRCGYRVVDASPGITDVPIATRIATANNLGADYFISFHYNASTGVWWDADGNDVYEVLCVSISAGAKTRAYAAAIQAELAKVIPWQKYGVMDDTKIMGNTLAVLSQTHMPAVLLETGFMDVQRSAVKMLDPAFQTAVAEAVCKGICAQTGTAYISPAAPAAPVQPLGTNEVYGVQVGAYTVLANAQAMQGDLAKAGFKGYIIRKDTKAMTYKEGV
jgi:N-acetylmuramoyl-L-alanine amidase